MDQFLCLYLNGVHDFWMTVPQIAHREARNKIKVFLALFIPNPTAFPFDQNDGITGVGMGNILFRQHHQGLRIHGFLFNNRVQGFGGSWVQVFTIKKNSLVISVAQFT